MSESTRWNHSPRRRPRGVAARRDGRWDLLLVSTAVLLLTAVARLHLLFPALDLLRPVLLSGVAAMVLYAADRHPRRRVRLLQVPATACVLGLAVWAALAVPTALRPARSFIFLTDEFFKTIALFIIVAGAVRGLRDLELLALVYFAGASAYAIVVLTRFDVGGGSWRLTELYTYDPNDFATFAVTALPIGIYFLARPGSVARRLGALVGCAALGTAFVWAGSRGGFLALLGMSIFLLLRYRAVPGRWRVAGTAMIAGVVLLVASEQYWTQMGTLLEPAQDYNLTAETGRLEIWKRGMGYMLDHPVFGVGIANFPVAEGVLSSLAERQQYGIGVRWTAPHNSFVQVGAELGVAGLLLFLALLAAAFRALGAVQRRALPPDTDGVDPRAMAQALTASLIGFLIGAFFLSLAYSPMLYALIALVVALQKVTLPLAGGRRRAAPTHWRASALAGSRPTTAAARRGS